MRFIINFLNGLIWGAGNPAVDTFHTDWNHFEGRDTGSPAPFQSREDFIQSLVEEQQAA